MVVVITAIATILLALVYRYLCVFQNKRRDKAGVMESFEHAYEDDVTDKKVCPQDLVPRFDQRVC